jgi:hypothetical protein
MPRTELRVSPELTIEIENFQATYAAGDTIIGRVVRHEHIDSPDSSVTINLLGRSKARNTRRSSSTSNTHTCRSSFQLFSPPDLRQILHSGPIQISPNGLPQFWPFSITIPLNASPAAVREANENTPSYLSLDPDDIVACPLPSSFYYGGNGWSTNFDGFVEYYLIAHLKVKRVDSRVETIESTVPLFIRPLAGEKPLLDYGLRRKFRLEKVTSHRLMPGMEYAGLSLRQRTQRLFNSSKIPSFGFTIRIEYPTIIQLENPNPISFKVGILPDDSTTTDIIRDVPQTAKLTQIELELKSDTLVRFPTSSGVHTDRKEDSYDFGLGRLFTPEVGEPVTIPTLKRKLEDHQACDVGVALQLRLDSCHAYVMGKPISGQFQKRIYPSFTTYNIRRTHVLRWDVGVEVGGETSDVWGEFPVEIVGPSGEQEKTRVREMKDEGMKKTYGKLLEGAGIGISDYYSILNRFVAPPRRFSSQTTL